MGPLPLTKRNIEYAIVDTDYFTKWVGAVPMCQITQNDVYSSRTTLLLILTSHILWSPTIANSSEGIKSNIDMTPS